MLYPLKWRYVSSGLLGMVLSSAVMANGTVRMQGSIIETACAIDVGSRDQTIDMGSLPLSQIQRDGQGNARPFVIRLVNCALSRQNSNKPDWQHFRVTFEGPHDRALFGVQGQAGGVGLEIRTTAGEVAYPGKAMFAQEITPGTRDLAYQLRLVANHQPLMSGRYYSLLRFKLDYE